MNRFWPHFQDEVIVPILKAGAKVAIQKTLAKKDFRKFYKNCPGLLFIRYRSVLGGCFLFSACFLALKKQAILGFDPKSPVKWAGSCRLFCAPAFGFYHRTHSKKRNERLEKICDPTQFFYLCAHSEIHLSAISLFNQPYPNPSLWRTFSVVIPCAYPLVWVRSVVRTDLFYFIAGPLSRPLSCWNFPERWYAGFTQARSRSCKRLLTLFCAKCWNPMNISKTRCHARLNGSICAFDGTKVGQHIPCANDIFKPLWFLF